MSTNFYLRTPDMAADDETRHLGQWTAGGFTFRANRERGITTYEAWLAQLDQGAIYTETGSTITREEMVEIANRKGSRRTPSWVERAAHFNGGFYDEQGRRWLTVDFC